MANPTPETIATKPLTAKQQAFISAYIGPAKFNATKAALIAGFTEASARQRGYELVNNSDIAARVKAELSSRALSADAVLDELSDIATADWRDFVTVRRNPRTAEIIDSKMDLSNKVKALELIGKAHGIFTDRIDLSGSLTSKVEIVGVDEADI